MAARKSCTKLTWDEAKAKVGINNTATKKKPIPKFLNHGDALTAKVIAKNVSSQPELSQHKSLLKKARREEERAAAAAAKREEDRERERAEQVVKPHEQARERMKELALQQSALQKAAAFLAAETILNSDIDLLEMKQISDCKQMQLDEIMALEAIFADTEELLVSEASNVEELREKIDEYQLDEEKEVLLRSITEHPQVSLYLQQTIEGDGDLVASVLLHVIYPPLYPLGGSTPHFQIAYFMVTNRAAVCSADKPLESLAYLEETTLRDALKTESGHILPDPCVYEVGVSWLSENLFDFVTMHTHGQHATKQ
jgi:hypothetical protein